MSGMNGLVLAGDPNEAKRFFDLTCRECKQADQTYIDLEKPQRWEHTEQNGALTVGCKRCLVSVVVDI